MCYEQKSGNGKMFFCGERKAHKCNNDGSYLILDKPVQTHVNIFGKIERITEREYVEHTWENFTKNREYVTGGTSYCTICGSTAIDRAFMEDFTGEED